jgi:hypothetical protein
MTALLLAVLLGGIAGAGSPEEEAKALLIRAIKAHGGEEALEKYRASRSWSKGKIKMAGLGEVEFIEEVATMLPNKFKELMRLECGGKTALLVTLVNGDKVSMACDGKAFPITNDLKKALQDAHHLMKISRLGTLLKDRSYEFAPLGEIKVEGKPAVGVRISARGKKDVNVYFDRETGLLAKVEHRTIDPTTRKEVTEERIILEYQKGKEGLPHPKKALIRHNGQKYLEAEVTEVELLEKLDDSVFEAAR